MIIVSSATQVISTRLVFESDVRTLKDLFRSCLLNDGQKWIVVASVPVGVMEGASFL